MPPAEETDSLVLDFFILVAIYVVNQLQATVSSCQEDIRIPSYAPAAEETTSRTHTSQE
jgi:hypothetical protein